MNIKFHTGSSQSPDYNIEFVAQPQAFYHTAIQVSGAFGRILLTKIDLRNATIWMADYAITEPVTLHGFADKLVYQFYFPVPPAFFITTEKVEENKPSAATQLHLVATDTHTVNLPAEYSKMLFIHYTRQYFNGNGSGINENIIDIFSPVKEQPFAYTINAATANVIKQIINASPANRVMHLYLEAKIKELLTLIYDLANPESPAAALTAKEIETLQQVKAIIMTHLSRTYTPFELSKLVASNAYTLKTNFKTWFGIPLHYFLHNCRMEKATELLLSTTLSIKEIAFSVGYKNVSNFSESFKNYYGYPPSKLREPD